MPWFQAPIAFLYETSSTSSYTPLKTTALKPPQNRSLLCNLSCIFTLTYLVLSVIFNFVEAYMLDSKPLLLAWYDQLLLVIGSDSVMGKSQAIAYVFS